MFSFDVVKFWLWFHSEILQFEIPPNAGMCCMFFLMIQMTQLQQLQMQEQFPQQSSQFDTLLKNIYLQSSQSHFQECIKLIEQAGQLPEYQSIQIRSLHAYALTMMKKFSHAYEILQQILLKHPYHLASKKRKAVLLEKMGKINQSKLEFQKCLFLQPESRSLKNKLKRLNMSSSNSEGFSSDSKESSNLEEKDDSQKTPSLVKFGHFQVIQFNTEDSDEHFALIKQQISKLSQKKPKKSILKQSMSASVFKEKKTGSGEIQTAVVSGKIDPQIDSFNICYEKGVEKKKSKSVSFKGDTKLQDVQ